MVSIVHTVVLKVYCFYSLTMPVQHKSIPRFSVISNRLGALCGIFYLDILGTEGGAIAVFLLLTIWKIF